MSDYSKENSLTDSLVVRPSFIRGLGRIWDFRGILNQYNASNTPQEADFKALKSDWATVGKDIKDALNIWKAK
jgi:hypothetical protein